MSRKKTQRPPPSWTKNITIKGGGAWGFGHFRFAGALASGVNARDLGATLVKVTGINGGRGTLRLLLPLRSARSHSPAVFRELDRYLHQFRSLSSSTGSCGVLRPEPRQFGLGRRFLRPPMLGVHLAAQGNLQIAQRRTLEPIL